MGTSDGRLGAVANFFIKHALAIFLVATLVCLLLVASLTSVLRPHVVGAWLLVGILTSLLFSGVALVVVLAMAAVDKVRHLKLITSQDKQSLALRERFELEKIGAADLYSPYFRVHEGKRFVKCELIGPGSIFLQDSSTLEDCSFHLCDIVVVAADERVNTAAYFQHSTFTGCRFVNLVIYMTEAMSAGALGGRCGVETGDLCVLGRKAG